MSDHQGDADATFLGVGFPFGPAAAAISSLALLTAAILWLIRAIRGRAA